MLRFSWLWRLYRSFTRLLMWQMILQSYGPFKTVAKGFSLSLSPVIILRSNDLRILRALSFVSSLLSSCFVWKDLVHTHYLFAWLKRAMFTATPIPKSNFCKTLGRLHFNHSKAVVIRKYVLGFYRVH